MSDEADVFQPGQSMQGGEFGDWTWAIGDAGHYWSFAVIPQQGIRSTLFRDECEIVRFFWSKDSHGNLIANFRVRRAAYTEAGIASGGGELNFKAIKLPSG
jgi:hypothetical protein